MKKILIVEDEKEIVNILKEVLTAAKYNIEVARDGLAGFHAFQNRGIDLIITDIMMPKLNGTTFIEMIRKTEKLLPIIAITAFDSEDKELEILSLGADDFISKPFSVPVLLKKVERLLEKTEALSGETGTDEENSTLEKYLDVSEKKYIYEGSDIELTLKEYQIMKKLIDNEGSVVSRVDIAKVIWDETKMHSLRNVDNHIRNLRKKIPGVNIQTHSKVGYRFVI